MRYSTKDYCWVITYHLNNIEAPIILTAESRSEALNVLPELVEKLKTTYPRIGWEETNLDKLENTRITEYGIRARGNPNLYLKIYKSYHI